MAPVFTYIQNFGKHFLPPLVLFTGILVFINNKPELANIWFADLQWLVYASLAIAILIAFQFGRSRLVITSFLLLLLVLPLNKWLGLELVHSQMFVNIIMLQISWLIWQKDKGFSPLNLLNNLLHLSALALLLWFSLPILQDTSQNYLAGLQSLLYGISPSISERFTTFEVLLIFALSLCALVRLLLLPNNTHSALFFSILILLSMQDSTLPRVDVIGLAAFYIYAVLSDSFNMAFKDELTGIPSRRALMQYVQTLGRKYVVVMSDIDHFKKFNDSYGHDVGDEVLKLVAGKLNKVTGGGKAFRYGGEEFVIIFPRKNMDEVTKHVEILRQAIADYPVAIRTKPRPVKPPKKQAKKQAKKTVQVTTSFGIAERTSELNEFSLIMKQADIALYSAKKAGRNCVKKAKSNVKPKK